VTPPRGAAVVAAAAAMALAAMAHGAPDAAAQDDAAAIAAEMATLYGMALDNEEMRSHLPDRLQMQMGKRPFMYEKGWFVVAGGQFRRHGGPLEGDPLFNGAAVIRPAGVDPGPGFPLFGHACLGEDSTVKNVFRSGSYHHSKAPYLPYALPPEYDPTDALGDWAEAPEASKARELGSRLAELYGMALDSAEVRSHLPQEITEAISLDVPESYYVHNAYFAPLDPLDPPAESHKYDPPWKIGYYSARVDGSEPTFCTFRPDLQALCG